MTSAIDDAVQKHFTEKGGPNIRKKLESLGNQSDVGGYSQFSHHIDGVVESIFEMSREGRVDFDPQNLVDAAYDNHNFL